MKIAFLWPPANSVEETLPLPFGLLFDVIRGHGHEVRLFNLPLEGWQPDAPEFLDAIGAFAPDLVGATAWPMSFTSSVATVRAVRQRLPGATYIIGGNYASLNPEVTYDTGLFDYVLMGEAERTFPRFLELLAARDRDGLAALEGIYFRDEAGHIVRNRNVFHADLDALGAFDYEFMELDRAIERGYQRTFLGARRKAPIIATRGCPYACHFCTVPAMNGTAPRHYSVGYLVGQITALYQKHSVRHINFMDDNPTMELDFFKELCRAIVARKKDGTLRGLVLENYRGTRLEHLDPEVCVLMKQAGFRHVVIAPESGSPRVRTMMNKEMSDEAVWAAVRMIKAAGLKLHGFFLVGYPGETVEERRQTYRFVREADFDAFKLHKFIALPGTASFRKLVKDGHIEEVYTPEGYLLGNPLPNFNQDDPYDVDREIFGEYAKFYLRFPWRIQELLRMAPVSMLWRALIGITRGAGAALGLVAKVMPSLGSQGRMPSISDGAEGVEVTAQTEGPLVRLGRQRPEA